MGRWPEGPEGLKQTHNSLSRSPRNLPRDQPEL